MNYVNKFSNGYIMKGSRFRRYFPKNAGDLFAMVLTMFALHFICLYELVVVLPTIDNDMTGTFWLHAFLGLYLYCTVMYCFVQTIVVDATSGSTVLPSILKPGWRFCSACEANAPPRSYHCWACNLCILRRDHHCMFTGNCIGHANQKYYISMIIYFWLGTSYCCFLNVDYTWDILGGYNWKSVFTIFMPLLSWLLGISANYNFVISFLSSTTAIAVFLLLALLFYHMSNIVKGQTVHENAARVKDYDLGWKYNLEMVFGINWRYAWIFPYVSSPQICDGISFATRSGGQDGLKDI